MFLKYSAAFQVCLYAYLLLSVLFIRSPIKSVFLFFGFRITFAIAAFIGVPSVGGMQYFLPVNMIIALQAVICTLMGRVRFKLNSVMLTFVIFIGMVLLTSVASYVTGMADPKENGGAADELFKIITPIFIYVLTYVGIRRSEDLDTASSLMIWTVVPCAFADIIQEVLGAGYNYETDSLIPGARGVGTVADANEFGVYIGLMLIAALPVILRKKTSLLNKMLFLLITFCVVLGRNRGTWIALAVAVVGAVFIYRKRLRILYWMGGFGTVALCALPIMLKRFSELGERDQWGQSQDTLSGRLGMQIRLLSGSVESPIFGFGPGSALTSEGNLMMPPHNDYVRAAYEFGYLTALCYMFFFFRQLSYMWRNVSNENWRFCYAAFALQIFVAVASLAYNLFADQILYSIIMFLMALSHRAVELGEGGTSAPRLSLRMPKPVASRAPV